MKGRTNGKILLFLSTLAKDYLVSKHSGFEYCLCVGTFVYFTLLTMSVTKVVRINVSKRYMPLM